MGIEIGPVFPDVLNDLTGASGFCAAEKNAMLQYVDQTACFFRFILASHIESEG
jgi:hypothetical protein